jgi:hypothetical protein
MSYAAIGKKLEIKHADFVFGVAQESFTKEVIWQHIVGFYDDGVRA